MKRSLIALCLLLFSFSLLIGEEINYQEKRGELEFSGRMIVRPIQAEFYQSQGLDREDINRRRNAAADRLVEWLIRYEPIVDEHIVDIPEGFDENSFAEMLMATGDYQYAEPDWICYPIDTIPNDPQYGSQWHHPKMQCPKAWDLFTGTSSHIAAFVDSGVDKDHPDLQAHLIPGYNAVDRKTELQGGKVDDINGHGTNVAGCIGAIGNNAIGVAGMNWTISLLPIRATNSSSGNASMSDLTHGALWAIQNGARTVSVSYTGVDSSSVGSTGTKIKNIGGLLIWAAGNAGYQISGSDWQDVIVVGATNSSDQRTSFSNYGQIIDVMAPGSSVTTTKNGGGYSSVSGTSFSAPLTNGACALIWGYAPTITPAEVEQSLFDGCDSMGVPSENGHGRINPFKSLLLALPPLVIKAPDGVPSGNFPPGPKTKIKIQIDKGAENYVAGSGKLHYRFSTSHAYSAVNMNDLGGGLFEAVIPNTKPGDEPEFYFSAKGDQNSTVYFPFTAPQGAFDFDVLFATNIFSDDFQTHKGWTIQNIALTDGQWDRGVPAGGGTRGDPDNDGDGSGSCYLTDNAPGNTDVDGGPTILTSPTIDFDFKDAQVSYYRWHTNDDNDDFFTVEVSNNNGATWVKAEQVKDTQGWIYRNFDLSSYVTPTNQVKIRFSSTDNPNDSVTESGVDGVDVTRILSDPSLWADYYSLLVTEKSEVTFNLDAGSGNGNRKFLLLGSFSGTSPGFPLPGGSVTVPLNWDAFTNVILMGLGGPVVQNFLGALDGQGAATAMFDSITPVGASFAGLTMNFAFVLKSPPSWDYVSNVISITFDL